MVNTNILCPDCFKWRILTSDNTIGHCDKCGTKFTILGKNQVKYYTPEATKHTSIFDFVYRKLHYIPMDKWDVFRGYQEVQRNDKSYDDPKYNWIMCISENARDTKYGRIMISEEFKLRRGQTMGEFYGTSTVD